MRDFSYHNQTHIVFGKNSEAQTGALARAVSDKVLLHYGGGSVVRSGLLDRVKASLRDAGVAFVELGGVCPNPRLSLVREGIALCRKEILGCILAVGGGSVIDSAKAVGMGAVYDGDVWDFFCGKPFPGTLPLGVVLTIPAAGSESSTDAVITNEDGWLKRGSCASEGMRPVFAVLNPALTFTLPPYQTAAGVSDIMAHVMERYLVDEGGVDVTDRLCEAVLRGVMHSAPIVLERPEDYNARAEIMWAGTLAHNNLLGVGRRGDWCSHRLGHELSALYDATHGATLSVMFPAWMKYVYKQNLPRFAQFAHRVMEVSWDPWDLDGMALEGIRRLEAFFVRLGLPVTIRGLGVENPDIADMARKATMLDASFGGLVRLDRAAIEAVYRLAV